MGLPIIWRAIIILIEPRNTPANMHEMMKIGR